MIVTAEPHIPVMRDRVVELLAGAPPGPVVDTTLGAGGHAHAVLEARALHEDQPLLVGIDRDPSALDIAARTLADSPGRLELVHARSDELDVVLDGLGLHQVAGVLYDLGVSSMHLDRADRGFSFRNEGPLDMRMDPTRGRSAEELVNNADESELAGIIRRYGEERAARRIASAIVSARPLHDTRELADVVRDAVPAAVRRGAVHPATRTFQALRIAVNEELDAFASSLPQAIARLAPGGVVVVLAYHSLEDRIAKRTFVEAASGCICPPDLPVCACSREPLVEIITRRVERPHDDEVSANPRSRSARLRAARRTTAEIPS